MASANYGWLLFRVVAVSCDSLEAASIATGAEGKSRSAHASTIFRSQACSGCVSLGTSQSREMVNLGIGTGGWLIVSPYFITYANNHLSGVVGMPRVEALTACGIALAVYVVANPRVRAVADRINTMLDSMVR